MRPGRGRGGRLRRRLARRHQPRLNAPRGVSPAADGGFLIADTGNSRIRRVAANGVITTVAGNGTADFGGDGDAATGASLNHPRDVAALPDGSFLVADTGNNRIRLVTTSGLIFTVAGGRRPASPVTGAPRPRPCSAHRAASRQSSAVAT